MSKYVKHLPHLRTQLMAVIFNIQSAWNKNYIFHWRIFRSNTKPYPSVGQGCWVLKPAMLPTSPSKPSSTLKQNHYHPQESKGRQLPLVVQNLVNEIHWSPPSVLLPRSARGATLSNWLGEAATGSLRILESCNAKAFLFVWSAGAGGEEKSYKDWGMKIKIAIATHISPQTRSCLLGGSEPHSLEYQLDGRQFPSGRSEISGISNPRNKKGGQWRRRRN